MAQHDDGLDERAGSSELDDRLAALARSHDRLAALVAPLDGEQLRARSYADDWSIAQVVSHLGSQSEIFRRHLDAALDGTPPPTRDDFPPIWDAWNARSPEQQAIDGIAVDGALVDRLAGLDDAQRASLAFEMFGMPVDAPSFVGMRLSEHAVHTWDVAVALEPAATIAADAVALLVEGLGGLAAHAGRPGGAHRVVRVTTTEPTRAFVLELGDAVSLRAAAPADAPADAATLALPAEALVRLVYGRLDDAHAAGVTATGIALDDLRAVFPGF